jgi:hypothetical protein
MKIKKVQVIIIALLLISSLMGCTSAQNDNKPAAIENNTNSNKVNNISSVESSMLDIKEMFADRDLEQSAELSSAVNIEIQSNKDVVINTEGVYVLTGEAKM